MKKNCIIICGVILSLSIMWLGSYLHTVIPEWAGFPNFATTIILCIIGCVLTFVYAVED